VKKGDKGFLLIGNGREVFPRRLRARRLIPALASGLGLLLPLGLRATKGEQQCLGRCAEEELAGLHPPRRSAERIQGWGTAVGGAAAFWNAVE